MTDEAVDSNPIEEDPNNEPAAEAPTGGDWKAEAGVAGNPSYDKFATIADLAKSHAELESYRGKSIRIPSDEAGQEQLDEFTEKLTQVPGVMRMPGEDDEKGWNNIYQQLGRPSAPEGYKFDEIPGFAGDAESEGQFRALAHEAGLSAKQANAIHNWLGSNIAQEQSAVGEQSEAEMGRLKGEWGQAFDHKLNMARNAAAQLEEKVPGIGEYFDNMAQNGYDANMIRLMDVFGEMMGESGAIQATPRTGMTPDEAKEMINDIRGNPEHPANNEFDPQHKAAREKMMELYQAAYPRA